MSKVTLSDLDKNQFPKGEITSPYENLYSVKEYYGYTTLVTGDNSEEVWEVSLPSDYLFDEKIQRVKMDTDNISVVGHPEIRIRKFGTLEQVKQVDYGWQQSYEALMAAGLADDKRDEIALIKKAFSEVEKAQKNYIDLILSLGAEEKEWGTYEDYHSWYEIPGIPFKL